MEGAPFQLAVSEDYKEFVESEPGSCVRHRASKASSSPVTVNCSSSRLQTYCSFCQGATALIEKSHVSRSDES